MKKTKLSKMIAMLTALVLVTVACSALAACGKDDPPPPPPTVTVTAITLDTTNAKTTFAYGEQFTTTGLKVTAKMSDDTTKDVALSDCTISTPNTKNPGTRIVTVTYQGKTARYEITVNDREMPKISDKALAVIERDSDGKDPAKIYTVEAEDIDLEISKVASADNKELKVADESVSGGKYMANYGVVGNYFGFTFTADKAYENVTLVFSMANATEEAISIGQQMKIYHNYKGSADSGELDIAGITALDAAATVEDEEGNTTLSYVWKNRAVRGITLAEGTNTLTFDIIGDKVPYIDSIKLYVNAMYSGESLIEITEEQTEYKMEFEDFNLEKIVNRQDMIDVHHLKPGQCFVEPANTNPDGTSKGTSAAAFTTGTEISTTIKVQENATVELIMRAANVSYYAIADNWEFYMDGVRMEKVQYKNIKDGSAEGNMFWQWQDTSLGAYNLAAGEHLFLAKLVGGHCNADIFMFNVLSWKEFTATDAVLNDDGSYIIQAENTDRSGWIKREEINSFTEDWSNDMGSGVCVKGFDTGSELKTTVSLRKDATLGVSFMMSYYDDAAFDFEANAVIKLNDTALTAVPAGAFGHREDGDYWKWVKVDLGKHELTAGDYTLSIVFNTTGMNIDCFEFVVNPVDEPDQPETDADVLLSEDKSYTVEAENLKDWSGWTQRPDMTGEPPLTEGWNNDMGSGVCVKGFGDGTVIKVSLELTKAATVAISFKMSFYDDVSYEFTNIKIGENSLTATPDGEFGHREANDYWKWVDVSLGEVQLEAGVHTLEITFDMHGVNLDCFVFTVNPAAAE